MGQRRNLVVIRMGDDPYCRRWGDLVEHERSWDCYVNYYGNQEIAPSIGQEMTFRHGVTKFIGIAELYDTTAGALDGYDALLFLDDDIEIMPAQIEEFFKLFHKHRLVLAQPSLHPASFFNHRVTVSNNRYIIRYTQFVEIMMPAFSHEAFALCLPTFRLSVSGWGLDYLWPQRLGFPRKKVAIVDAVAVRHSKPSDPQQGAFYQMLRGLDIDAQAELDELIRTYNIDAAACHRERGGVMKQAIWQRSLEWLRRHNGTSADH